MLGLTVIASYGNYRTYRIDDINFNLNPHSKFTTKDGPVKFIHFSNYFSPFSFSLSSQLATSIIIKLATNSKFAIPISRYCWRGIEETLISWCTWYQNWLNWIKFIHSILDDHDRTYSGIEKRLPSHEARFLVHETRAIIAEQRSHVASRLAIEVTQVLQPQPQQRPESHGVPAGAASNLAGQEAASVRRGVLHLEGHCLQACLH